jgi:hypothetical protein
MFEPAGQLGHDERGSDAPPETPGASPADAPPYPHCSRCHTDLTHCFLSARFCPRCGVVLASLPGERLPAVPRAAALVPVPPPPLPVLTIEPSEGRGTHSLILGYANAMFRLGWRYENGDGTCRNDQEAVRCYFKAAKLGNASARARLTPQNEDAPALPYATDAPTAG